MVGFDLNHPQTSSLYAVDTGFQTIAIERIQRTNVYSHNVYSHNNKMDNHVGPL